MMGRANRAGASEQNNKGLEAEWKAFTGRSAKARPRTKGRGEKNITSVSAPSNPILYIGKFTLA